MYCLEKLQETLTQHLQLMPGTLKDISEILSEQGYTHVRQAEKLREISGGEARAGTGTANKQDPSPENPRKLIKSEVTLTDIYEREQVRNFFHAAVRESQPKEIRALFNTVLNTASHLGVSLVTIADKKATTGHYKPFANEIVLDFSLPKSYISPTNPKPLPAPKRAEQQAQTLLHELIHSTITRAQMVFKKRYSPNLSPYEKQILDALTPRQKRALQEITELYDFTIQEVKRRENTLGSLPFKKPYGLESEKEFVAELANPEFRAFLKKQNIYARIYEAMKRLVIKFFTADTHRPYIGDERTTTFQHLLDAYNRFLLNTDIGKASALPRDTSKGDEGIVYKLAEGEDSLASPKEKEFKNLEADSLESIKQKTIDKINNYTKLQSFKILNKDKQQAILHLKEIKPAPMPSDMPEQDFSNLIKHFNTKQDKTWRNFYLKLFNDTKENPNLILDTEDEAGVARKAYIKAYQHKETHDLYYLAVTEDGDKINITGYVITEIMEVIRQIRRSKWASVIKDSNQAPPSL